VNQNTTKRTSRFRLTLGARQSLYGYAFVLLWVIGFAAFTMIPLVQTSYTASTG